MGERRTHDLLDNSVKSNDGGIVTPRAFVVLMPIGGHFVMDPRDAAYAMRESVIASVLVGFSAWKCPGQMS